MGIRVPQIVDIENAVKIYYSYVDLSNKEIKELFGKVGSAKLCRLKKLVVDEMDKRGLLRYNSTTVRTDVAYEVWGLNISDMEKKLTKLRKLCG